MAKRASTEGQGGASGPTRDAPVDRTVAQDVSELPLPTVVTTLATCTIAAGQSLSAAVDCRAATPIRIRMPNGWTGGTTDRVTFQGSTDNVTFWNLHRTDGTEISGVVIPGPNSVILPTDLGLKGGQWIKIRAGTKDRPIVQDEQRDFVLVLEA